MSEDQKVVDYLAVMLAEKNNIIKKVSDYANDQKQRADLLQQKSDEQDKLIIDLKEQLKASDEKIAELLNNKKKGGKNNG